MWSVLRPEAETLLCDQSQGPEQQGGTDEAVDTIAGVTRADESNSPQAGRGRTEAASTAVPCSLPPRTPQAPAASMTVQQSWAWLQSRNTAPPGGSGTSLGVRPSQKREVK